MPVIISKAHYVGVVLAVTLFASATYGSGFQIFSQDAKSMGMVDAGDAANIDSAADEFYNPASMMYFDKVTVSSGLAFIRLNTQYNGCDDGSCYVKPPGTIFANRQNIYGNVSGSTNNFAPNFHIIAPINNKWSVGFGVTVPFGLSSDYSANSPVAEYATETDLRVININPNIAYAITPRWSFGLGLDVDYGYATYDDSLLTNDLDGWGCGFNVGTMFDVTKKTRVGLSYRSQINITAVGDSTFVSSGAVTQASVKLPMPAYTTLGITQQVTDNLKLLASIFYTQWSVLDTITLYNASPAKELIVVPQDFKDSWYASLGGEYQVSSRFKIGSSIGFDQSPSQDGMRDIRLPDSDRISTGLNLRYQPSKAVLVDLAYQHVFMGDAAIYGVVYEDVANVEVSDIVSGSSSSSADIIALQIAYRFNA